MDRAVLLRFDFDFMIFNPLVSASSTSNKPALPPRTIATEVTYQSRSPSPPLPMRGVSPPVPPPLLLCLRLCSWAGDIIFFCRFFFFLACFILATLVARSHVCDMSKRQTSPSDVPTTTQSAPGTTALHV